MPGYSNAPSHKSTLRFPNCLQIKQPVTSSELFLVTSSWLLVANFSQNKQPATSNWLLVANFVMRLRTYNTVPAVVQCNKAEKFHAIYETCFQPIFNSVKLISQGNHSVDLCEGGIRGIRIIRFYFANECGYLIVT